MATLVPIYHFKQRQLALLVSLAFYAGSLWADTAATSINIPAQSLDTALQQLAQQNGVQILFVSDLVKGLQSSKLQGQLTFEQAAQQLLQQTHLQLKPLGEGRYSIVKISSDDSRPVTTMPKLVSGAKGESATSLPLISLQAQQTGVTEGTHSYTTHSMSTATKLNLSMRETPQSVSVLTRQQIDDMGLTTLDDAVKNVTGLVMQKGYYAGDSGSFTARGFTISNIMLDGLPMSTGAGGTYNADNDALDIYDRVEVVRGATGLLNGVGTPSATINLVRKRPTADTQGSVSLSGGSWNNYRAMMDVSGRLNTSGSVRGRTVLVAQDSDKFYRNAESQKGQLYAIVEADLMPDLLATVGVSYRKVDDTGGYQSLPNLPDGRFFDISRKTNLANDFDFWKQEDLTFFSSLDYSFANNWKLKLAGNWKRQDQDLIFSDIGIYENGLYYQAPQHYKAENRFDGYDLSLMGDYRLFDRQHELMLGASYREKRNKNWGGWADYAWTTDAPVVDPYQWDASSVSQPNIPMDKWLFDNQSRERGLYAATRLNLADSLKLLLGSRLNWYKYQTLNNSTSYSANAKVTPYAGVIYDLNQQHSLYASWTEIFEPQSNIDRYGKQLEPITGTNYEVGIKGEYFEGRLNASLAGFLIQQQNRAVSDLDGPNPCPGKTSGYCSRAAGEVESKGFEAEISGALTDAWQITAGYTYVQSKYTKDVNAANIGKIFNSSLPKQQLKLSTDYRLSGILDKLRLGASVYAQSPTQSSDDPNIKQGGYAVVGIHGVYDMRQDLSLQLNVNNLFDKIYYTGLGWGTSGTTYGEPRNVMMTVKYKF